MHHVDQDLALLVDLTDPLALPDYGRRWWFGDVSDSLVKNWWAEVDGRQNRLRDVAGEPVSFPSEQRMCIVHYRSIVVNVLRPSGAFGVLPRESAVWDFFLESQCRAMRPVTMAFRLAPTCATSSSHLNLWAASDPPIR